MQAKTLIPDVWRNVFEQIDNLEDLVILSLKGRAVCTMVRELIETLLEQKRLAQIYLVFNLGMSIDSYL